MGIAIHTEKGYQVSCAGTLLRVLPQIDLHFMKKIPAGAEACNVLVGELEFLNKPVVAFIRLSPAVLLTGLAEVPIATRLLQHDLFIYVLKCVSKQAGNNFYLKLFYAVMGG